MYIGLGAIFIVWLILQTRRHKPRQFHYRARYDSEEERENKSISEQMYEKWERIPFKDKLQHGKARLIFNSVAFVAFLYLIAIVIEKIEAYI